MCCGCKTRIQQEQIFLINNFIIFVEKVKNVFGRLFFFGIFILFFFALIWTNVLQRSFVYDSEKLFNKQ